MEFWEIFWEHLVTVARVAWSVITGPGGIFVLACAIFFVVNVVLCLTWDWTMFTKMDDDSLAFRASYCVRWSVGGVLYFLLGVTASTCIKLIPSDDSNAGFWILLLSIAYLMVVAYTAWCVHKNRNRFRYHEYPARKFWLEELP